MNTVLLALTAGAVIGIALGALGGGGGVLGVPVLIYLLGLDPAAAATASLLVVSITSVTALARHAGNVHWRTGAVFAAAGVLPAIGAATLAEHLPRSVLTGIFAMIAAAAALALVRAAPDKENPALLGGLSRTATNAVVGAGTTNQRLTSHLTTGEPGGAGTADHRFTSHLTTSEPGGAGTADQRFTSHLTAGDPAGASSTNPRLTPYEPAGAGRADHRFTSRLIKSGPAGAGAGNPRLTSQLTNSEPAGTGNTTAHPTNHPATNDPAGSNPHPTSRLISDPPDTTDTPHATQRLALSDATDLAAGNPIATTATAVKPPLPGTGRALMSGGGLGAITGLLGVGGGFLAVPTLVTVMRLRMRAAVATSLFVIAVNSSAALATRLSTTAPDLDWAVLGPFAGAALLGGWDGKRLSAKVSETTLRRLFAVLLFGVAVFMLVDSVIRHVAG